MENYSFPDLILIRGISSFPVPTLGESTWPESLLSSPVVPFSKKRFHYLSSKASSSCRKLIQSYRTAVDPRGNIWILDNGSESSNCAPKLIILSLNFFNQEVKRMCFNNYPANSFTDLVLDTGPLGIKYNTTRAYLSVRDRDYILSYSMSHNEVKRLKIQPSHTDVFTQQSLSITAMTMMTSMGRGEVAIIYDNLEKGLYYVDLRIGRSQGQVYAIYLGTLLGSTKSLTVDPDGILYYSTDRDGAVFRWNTKSKLSAENHEVLLFQSSTIAQILIGTQGGTYLINEKPIDEFELVHSQKILSHYSLESNSVRCTFCN